MGNNCCCSGRPDETVLKSETLTQANPKLLTMKTAHKKRKKTTQIHPHPSWQEILSTYMQHTAQSSLKLSDDVYPTSSRFSSPGFIINYTLPSASGIDHEKQIQILGIFDRFKSDEVIEEMDGLCLIKEITPEGNHIDRCIIISTCALYILEANDFSKLYKRIAIESIKILAFTEDRQGLLIKTNKDRLNDIVIQSDKCENIIKSIEQLYFEKLNNFLPWAVVQKLYELVRLLSKNLLIVPYIDDMRLIRVIIEFGVIGERQTFLKKCKLYDNKELFYFLLITDSAVYLLDFLFDFFKKIPLKDLQKIEYTKAKSLLRLVSFEEIAVVFQVPESILKSVFDNQNCMLIYID